VFDRYVPTQPEEGEDEGADDRKSDNRSEGTREHHRRERFAGEDHDLRTENGGDDAASEHPGNGARLELRRRIVGGGKAELLHESAAGAYNQQADDEEPEAHLVKSQGRNCAAEPGDDRTRHEAATLADRADDGSSGNRSRRNAHSEGSNRCGCQRLVGVKQIVPGKAANRHGDRRGRADNRLGGCEDESCPARLAIQSSGGHEASLPLPSPRMRRATRSSTAFTSFGSSSL
jgi:hypothetical protein